MIIIISFFIILLNNVSTINMLKYENPITIVTAIWEIPSKHDHQQYEEWSHRFFSQKVPLIVFTSSSILHRYKKIRDDICNQCLTHWMIDYDLPSQLPMFENITEDNWKNQHDNDPERHIHKSYELYAIWIGKSWMLYWTSIHNIFKSEYFIWEDIGVFRSASNPMIKDFDSIINNRIPILDNLFINTDSHRILMSLQPESDYKISGGYIVGKYTGIQHFYMKMASIMFVMNKRNLFWGKDQILYLKLVIINLNEYFLFDPNIIMKYVPSIDPWFLFPYFIAQMKSPIFPDTFYDPDKMIVK